MSFSIQYTDKKGSSHLVMTCNQIKVIHKIKSLYANKIEATVYKDGKKIGGVFADESQRTGFNWIIAFGKQTA